MTNYSKTIAYLLLVHNFPFFASLDNSLKGTTMIDYFDRMVLVYQLLFYLVELHLVQHR
ncbi:hypothetical protein LSP03_22540 [Lysinibacillus sphaericus]|nr:hypothetical protein LSP03_22540 [Lysinibacillus sphaericus]